MYKLFEVKKYVFLDFGFLIYKLIYIFICYKS